MPRLFLWPHIMDSREYDLTPPQIRKELSVSHDKVLGWIRSGELFAVNLASTPDSRPRWHIARADLEAFLARRSATPTPRSTRRRRADDTPHYV